MLERNLNQLQLSKILGIRQSQISYWLNGRSQPGYSSIELLCKKLDLDVRQLFDNNN